MAVKDRTRVCRKNQCNICNGKVVEKGINDFPTLCPAAFADYNFKNNPGIDPFKLSMGSNKAVNWKCHKCGHEYTKSVKEKCRTANYCEKCQLKILVKGKNDFASQYPEFAKEWSKKNEKGPEEYFAHSNDEVLFNCSKCGREYSMRIDKRADGHGCPHCGATKQKSFPEYQLLYYLNKVSNDWIHTYKDFGFELDLYNPKLKIAIEYDGSYFHKNKLEKDTEKNRLCQNLGIQLFRIREKGLPSFKEKNCQILHVNEKNFIDTIKAIIYRIYKQKIDIDIKNDLVEINHLCETEEMDNSISITHPSLCKEAVDSSLTNLSAGSRSKLTWDCPKCHHTYTATIYDRALHNTKCPYCSSRKFQAGVNDLGTKFPESYIHWDRELNKDIGTPEDFYPSSSQKAYFTDPVTHKTVYIKIKSFVDRIRRQRKKLNNLEQEAHI